MVDRLCGICDRLCGVCDRLIACVAFVSAAGMSELPASITVYGDIFALRRPSVRPDEISLTARPILEIHISIESLWARGGADAIHFLIILLTN